MTDEDPAGSQGGNRGGNRGGNAPAPAPAGLLSVVAFDRHDPITGTDRTVVGVVVDTDDQGLTVRPLAEHHYRVPRDAVSVVTDEDDEV